jgi:ubiquitin carboxyl-terminal hydrolase 36/42
MAPDVHSNNAAAGSPSASSNATTNGQLTNGRYIGSYNSPKNGNSNVNGHSNGNGPAAQANGSKSDGIPVAKHMICTSDRIHLEWKQPTKIGAGYSNLGNTCFMNSVLQCLTHCPPLVNYLLYSKEDHVKNCKVISFCMTCELVSHMRRAIEHSGDVIRPHNIFQRLKSIAKHFQHGRQEDSHEFLRYVIDNIWKSCVMNWESSHSIKLDAQSKETTFINQIFGGYHRSQITCLCCNAKSNTYDYFMDFILDIKVKIGCEE